MKFKLYLLITISALLVIAVITAFAGGAGFSLIKLLILLVFFGAGYFLLRITFLRETGILKKDCEALQERLKEKRIQLKVDVEPELIPVNSTEELPLKVKGGLENLSLQLREQLHELREQAGEKSDDASLLKELFSTYAEKEETRNKDINDIQSNYKTIAQNTNKAFTISDNLTTQAKNAFDLSGNVQEGVKVVNSVLKEVADKSNNLFEQSKKISKIIEIISEISSKTHILSINASIVSARAGKDGKAFEVVSKEIRKLATETDSSLGEIEAEIITIQDIIRSVVQGINEANTKTMEEQDLLTAVIGALQGVTLGVEVLRAVSNVVNTKTVKQKELIENVIGDYRNILADINSVTDLQGGKIEPGDLENYLSQLNQILVELESPAQADTGKDK